MDSRSRRPTHIVAFRRRSENNVDVLRQALNLKPAVMAMGLSDSTPSILSFEPRTSGEAVPKLLEKSAVAAISLSEEDVEKLQQDKAVALVARNEQRSIPRPTIAEDSPVVQTVATEAITDTTPAMVAYLRGMRDMINFLLGEQGGRAVAGPPFADLIAKSTALAPSAPLTWALRAIGIASTRYTGAGVKAAVLDTGIDFSHPDFAARFVEGQTARSFLQGLSVQDGNGHGTHCAGVLGGPRQPQRGPRYGVAPDVDLLIGKVLNDQGDGYDNDIIEGIEWAADAGASIVSMSLGSRRSRNASYSQLYERVAATLIEDGVLIVSAAGNDSARPDTVRPVANPAACPSILAVGAVDAAMRVGSFSNGSDKVGKVEIAGPGVSVHSAWTGGGYRSINGTSMAVPHVAGVAALLLESSPMVAARDLWTLLVRSAKSLGNPDDFGAGLVQAP